jgi:beta-lactamase regulating signal transducer with metallopeptidase domain/polyhydroxyalkanoate synthesis regulator protein
MLGWFAETTLIAAGLLLIAVVVSQLRSVGPTARHVLWLVVMIKLITPPLLSWPWATSSPFSKWFITSTEDVPDLMDVPLISVSCGEQCESKAELIAMEPSLNHGNLGRSPMEGASSGPPRDWGWSTKSPAVVPPQDTFKSLSAADLSQLAWWAVLAWLVGSAGLAVGQAIRILQFRHLLRAAIPAPDLLVCELERISERLGVPAPQVLVLPDLGTPMLWCLGRPRLLLPARLVKTLSLDRWRGILTHELAHLRRGDHWVSRLELAAGLIWWWNPIYWVARARLNVEAELACDAWVVWALPKDRIAYAEVLFDVCALLSQSPSTPPSPALGVAGSGHFFERRLTLILHDHVPCRLSPLALLGACLLLLFAVPSWSKAEPAAAYEDPLATVSVAAATGEECVVNANANDDDDDANKIVRNDKDDADDADADDDNDGDEDNDEDDDDAPRRKQKTKAKATKSDRELDVDLTGLKKEIESKFGSDSDFEKKVEELGEKIGKEMEAIFGAEFEKKMEAFGKEMEAKFGEDSEIAKKMEAFGKEMEAKFGAGSDFEKKMKDLGEDMKKKYDPGSEFAKNLKDKVDVDIKAKKKTAEKQSSANAKADFDRAQAAKRKALTRERQIQKLEAQIRELVDEIKALKAEGSEK